MELISNSPEWTPPPVPDGASLLRELEQFIFGFVVLPPHALLPITLWVIATHVFDIFDAFPFLILSSPAPRCGKTRTLETLELLVARPRRTANVSEAALFRLADSTHPTFLLDEQETLSEKTERAEALRGLLNAGHRRGSKATRCAGANRDEVREFDVYCPKILAGIGDFPATLRDRGIVVPMQRRQASQSVTRFIYRLASQVAANLKAQIESWTSNNRERIRTIYETAPSAQFLSDREEENWAPLFSILAITHPSRLSELRADAEALSRRKAEADDEQTQALEILKQALEVWSPSEATITTKELIARLQAKEDSPTFKPDGSRPEVELSPRRLARMVRGFGVHPINVRLAEGGVRKGYRRGELEAALSPYLPVLSATAATGPRNQEVVEDFPSATQGLCSACVFAGNPSKTKPRSGCSGQISRGKGMRDNDRIVVEALRAMESAFATRSAGLKSAPVARTPSVSVPQPSDDRARRERVRTVVGTLSDLPGESEWLQHQRPDVWNHCIALLRRIEAAWFAPMQKFDEALWLFEIAWNEARELYRSHLQKPAQGVLESDWASTTRKEG